MREIAEHPAQRVAELAIGIDGGLQDFGTDAQIIGVIGSRDPHPQNIGARLFHHVLRRHHIAERLRHLAAVLVENEAVGEHRVVRRDPARAARFQQRGVEPAAMLVGAFEIHHRVGAAVLLAANAGEAGEVLGVFEHEGVGRARIEPDVENVVDFFPILVRVRAEKTRARTIFVPSVRPLQLEGIGDALVDRGVLQNLHGAVALFPDKHGDRHAPGALARDHPIGARLDHAIDAVLAGGRHPAGDLDRLKRAGA